jgi:SepF-like predicted cell division protein (DUF552 family)
VLISGGLMTLAPFRRKNKEKDKQAKDSASKGKVEDDSYMQVRFLELTGLIDVTTISDEVRNGNFVVLDVAPLVKQGSEQKLQLKRAVDQLRAVCFSVDGDIGQLGNRYILLTPTKVKISRESASDEDSSEEHSSTT